MANPRPPSRVANGTFTRRLSRNRTYEKVRTIDLALKKLTPEELVTLSEAFQSLLTLGYGYLELCLSRPSISWYPDSNLIVDATRNRLLGNLERFKEESAKSIF